MIELIIEGVKADLSNDISADITYSLADIRTPDKRQVNYSKTITLVGTANNNYIFGNIFDIDVENEDNNPALPNVGVNFTPKKLAKAKMFDDGIQIFEGSLRLWQIAVRNGVIIYETSLFGKLFDIFSAIGDGKLTDLDFSDLNHAYTWPNIKATWEDSFTGAFRYPLIDYGYNVLDVSGRPASLKFASMLPAIYYSVFIDKIFAAAGATYTLNFSDRSIYDRILLAATEKGQATGRPKYYNAARVSTDKTYSAPSGDTTVSIADLHDTVIDNGAGITLPFGVPQPRRYTFTSDLFSSFQFHIEASAFKTSAPLTSSATIKLEITLFHPSDGTGTVLSTYNYQLTPGTNRTSFNMEVPPTDFNNTEYMYMSIYIPHGYQITLHKGTGLKGISPTDNSVYPLVSGDIFDMSTVIPKDVKQVDFIRDFIKLFNLFVTQDPDDSSNYIITPQVDFYNTDKILEIDWTKKIDHSEEITFKPIAQLTAKKYVLTWKQDTDYWNTLYFNQNKEVYGQVTYISDTDVLTNTETIEMLFSPTTMQRYTNSSVLCPHVYKVENVSGVPTRKPDAFNARLLIWGGLQEAGHDIDLLKFDGSTLETITDYPYAGHIDDPLAPTFDLNFGNTNTDLPTASVNQFSKYWGTTLLNVSDKDGKLVSCTMYIKSEDIEKLDFSALYRVDNQYYRLNKIEGFNPFIPGTSKVELIKVVNQ